MLLKGRGDFFYIFSNIISHIGTINLMFEEKKKLKKKNTFCSNASGEIRHKSSIPHQRKVTET